MHFSCKISNAVLTILEEQGEDLTPLYEQTHLAVELLRDSSYWVSAPDMEMFLETALRLPLKQDGNILQRAGHEGPNLRAWGVLDSVLRMMPRPQEIFNQPEQFLSYFISPKPPIDNLRRDANSIAFDLPLPAEQYPLVTTYLKAAFESLPVYVGQPLARCEWDGITITLNWSTQQSSIFNDQAENIGHQVSPDLFKSLIEDLQSTQREREDLQKYVGDLEEKIRDLEKQKLQQAVVSVEQAVADKSSLLPQEGSMSHLNFDSQAPGYVLNQNLARMHDYMVRAQQLITMLVAQGKMTPAVKEAMRRVDWEHVKTQYPRTVFESMELVKKANNKQTHSEGSSHV
ncbi:hypothetical protein AZI86_10180 [Bdellovibrio bacteriovorus]|uniref:Uncharacterized protein n=1 Tax=Bdellovibrio bacteriovorus TaxID=959 RepID=A0A150WSB9_BDEBC|nr:hypothetical protein [Bdellovibrio bacteriovorus]KYG67352.1 hypothetical protein AZI86_10180 [Bdellovibrio bacteriovorus]